MEIIISRKADTEVFSLPISEKMNSPELHTLMKL